jgi:hypothetical protein
MNPVVPTLHGIEPEKRKVYFAAAQFIRLLESTYARPGLRHLKNAPTWPHHTFDDRFRFAAEKLWDTIWKINRLAELFELASRNLKELEPPSVPIEEVAKLTTALSDIPIYLEALIVYLRVFADSIANLTPYLYGQKGKNLPRDSFREQRKWFAQKRSKFDPNYTAILNSSTRWFDVLAGDQPKFVGLRDAVIHYRGGIQLMYQPARTDRPTRVIATLFSDYSTISNDLIATLQKLFRDMCVFLDQFIQHFVQRANNETGSLPFNISNPQAVLLFQYDGELPSAWLYPQVILDGSRT